MRRHPTAFFEAKEVGLGFPCLASKLAEARRRMVHVESSRRSRGCEAKAGRFDGVGCGAAEVIPNYPYFVLAHRGILVFGFVYKWTPRAVVRGILLVSLSHPLGLGLSF
jgi:hypothetical protein